MKVVYGVENYRDREVSEKKQYCGCENFRGKSLAQIFSETITNMDETGLFAWTTAVVIGDACEVDMTAGNDSDWLKRTLTLVMLWGSGRPQWRPLCQAFLWQGLSSPTPRVGKACYSGYVISGRTRFSGHAQSIRFVFSAIFVGFDGKSVKRGLPVLDPPRRRDSWC